MRLWFQILKETKQAFHGLWASGSIISKYLYLSSVTVSGLIHSDWISMPKSCHNLGNCLWFKTGFAELYQDQVQHNLAYGTAITEDFFLGPSIYEGAGNQLH